MIPVVLLVLAAACTGLGLGNLYSADLHLDGSPGGAFTAQATHALVGVGVFAFLSRVPLAEVRRYARWTWLVGVVALVLVLASGHLAGGARSWLVLGPLRLQPSELFKVLLPLALAAELTRNVQRAPETRQLAYWLGHRLERARAQAAAAVAVRLVGVVVLIGVPVLLIASQPDLGAVGLLALGAASLLWLSGLPRWLVFSGIGLGLAAAPIGFTLLAPYQRSRILTFLDPTRDPTGDGYQTLQSLYAVSSGGITGRGFLEGTQGRLGFLPEHTTDFILAHLSEEWGMLGALLCLGLLFSLVGGGLVVAERARNRFSALLAAGLAVQLAWQILVNAGGMLGLLPLTGVTLPLFSYGGSSLLQIWASLGLLAAIARSEERRGMLAATETSPRARMDRPRPLLTLGD